MKSSSHRRFKLQAGQTSAWAWLCLCLAMLFSSAAQAQTVVSGTINSSTTWQAANGPYVVTGDITIPANVVLTIEAGTQIFMGAGTGITSNGGAIRATGTAGAPIKVQSDKLRTSQTPAAGDWKRWILNASSQVSSFDHVLFEHGQGLEFNSSSATLNYCTIRNQLGAAISQNLAASLSGGNNSASGNSQNAVLLPSGDISGSVRWELQGIPYLLAGGQISVGASPQLGILNPGNMQSGDSITATITGTRLAGAGNARFSGTGVTAQVLPGASDTQLSLQISASASAGGDYALSLQTDAGEVLKTGALSVTRQQPRITTIDPASIYINRGTSVLTISGNYFAGNSVAMLDEVAMPTTYQSTSRLLVDVANQINPAARQITLRTPDPLDPARVLTSNAVTLTVATPAIALAPATLSMVAGANKTAQITLPFAAPAGGVAFSLASSSSVVASVPGSISVAAGQQSVSFAVQGVGVGSASISIGAAGWQSAALPVTVIEAPIPLSLTPINAPAVGVLVGNAGLPPPPQNIGPVNAARVGVLLGTAISQVSPKVGVVGSSVSVVLQGVGLNEVNSVGVLPAAGVSVGTPVISPDGKQASVTVTVDANAAKGARQWVVRGTSGNLLFLNPDDGIFLIAAPVPELDSVTPQVLLAGQPATKLTVRGRNFRDISGVRFDPPQGLSVSGAVSANSDGNLLELNLLVDASAVSGPHVMIVQAAGGDSSAVALPGNTLQVAHQLGNTFDSVGAPLVGVLVGAGTPPPAPLNWGPLQAPAVGVVVGEASLPPAPRLYTPLNAPAVGVVVGSIATQMSPKVGVVGTQLNVNVQGLGLASVVAAEFVPNTGLAVSNLLINPEGSQLNFTLTVDAAAAKTQRMLVLRSASGTLLFANPQEALLLVAAPAPTLISIAPQVVVAGQPAVKLTARGVNFRDVLGVRFVPPDGIAAIGSATASLDGTLLEVNVQADPNAVSGPRSMVVMTAGGDSSSDAVPANTFQVARQLGTDLQAINAPAVGVLVGAAYLPLSNTQSAFSQVGVVVGAVASDMQPVGALKGSSGELQISGIGLTAFAGNSASLTGSNGAASGVVLGSVLASQDGSSLRIPYSVAANAVTGQYRLVLSNGGNTLLFNPAQNNQFWLQDEPVIDSIVPTVLQTGRAYTLTVRGSKLQNVRSITLEDANGPLPGLVVEANALQYAVDTFGEKLSVRVVLDPQTATGPVVLRLNYAGGATGNQASSANTINIVNP